MHEPTDVPGPLAERDSSAIRPTHAKPIHRLAALAARLRRPAILPEGVDVAQPAPGLIELTVPVIPGGTVRLTMTRDETLALGRALVATARLNRRSI